MMKLLQRAHGLLQSDQYTMRVFVEYGAAVGIIWITGDVASCYSRVALYFSQFALRYDFELNVIHEDPAKMLIEVRKCG